MPSHINERVQEIEKELIFELQKQFSKKIVHSMIMIKADDLNDLFQTYIFTKCAFQGQALEAKMP